MWAQNYYPLGRWLSGVFALLPIAAMFILLSMYKVKGHIAALAAFLLTFLVSFLVFGFPARMALLTVISGVLAGLFPVMYIIIGAIFIFNTAQSSGQFVIIKNSLEFLTRDRRLQALIIAYAFGAFLDATAGFVVPVAIAASILAGLGFDAKKAAIMALLASASPAPFGAISVPIVVLTRVTGLPIQETSVVVGRQTPFLSLLIPFWMIIVLCGWRKTREVFWHLLVCGASYGLATWLVSNYITTYLTGIVSALFCLLCLVAVIRLRQPRTIYCFESDKQEASENKRRPATGELLWGWSPFIILATAIVVWSMPAVDTALARFALSIRFNGLTQLIRQLPPVVLSETLFPGPLSLNIPGSAGTAIFISAALNLLFCRFPLKKALAVLRDTFYQLRFAAVNILSIFALSYLLNYSGMAGTLGLIFAGTGVLFPFFAPFLAWLSTSITGSNTATCAMLGNIQVVAARRLGISTLLAGGTHATAAVAGKIIAPQSLAVAATTTNSVGIEGELLRKLFFHSLLFALIVALISVAQAYIFPGMIPAGF